MIRIQLLILNVNAKYRIYKRYYFYMRQLCSMNKQMVSA